MDIQTFWYDYTESDTNVHNVTFDSNEAPGQQCGWDVLLGSQCKCFSRPRKLQFEAAAPHRPYQMEDCKTAFCKFAQALDSFGAFWMLSQNGILWNYSRKSAAKKRETLSSESFRNFFVAQFWGSFKSKWEACVARQHVCLGHLLRRPMIGSPGTDAKL